MTVGSRLRDLPLRYQCMLVFSFFAVATTAISSITLTTLAARREVSALQDKSRQYARQLQGQLRPVIAFDDRLTARELFESLAVDGDVDGLGIYDAVGVEIAGQGIRPRELPALLTPLQTDPGHVITIAPVKAREGREGRVFVSLASAAVERQNTHAIWIAIAQAVAIVLTALLLAANLSRRFARRLMVIADAAQHMASGPGTTVRLDDRARDEIGSLARTFNAMVCDLNRLAENHERMVRTERERLERLVVERTQDLERGREVFRLIAESTRAIPFTLDAIRGCFTYIGVQACNEWDLPEAYWYQPGALDAAFPRPEHDQLRDRIRDCRGGPFEFEACVKRQGRPLLEYRWMGTCEISSSGVVLRGLMQDVTELRRLERELAAAQKLESVGRLAAGIAHEINTPVQFVSDNVEFLRIALAELATICGAYRQLQRAVAEGGDVVQAAAAARAAELAADLDFILQNAPLSLASAMDGLGRIATIVRSIKTFAHPDQGQKIPADLNLAIQSTIVMAHNEYKYVAELDTEYGDLPMVCCYIGEINQVVLNLLVNAAHAIGDTVNDGGMKGRISVRTRLDGGEVEISIADNGNGIPESARSKIFEPFFTTKEVGRGTGQGLAIARSVIVGKHRGALWFETETGRGTTFFIRLPVQQERADAAGLAA